MEKPAGQFAQILVAGQGRGPGRQIFVRQTHKATQVGQERLYIARQAEVRHGQGTVQRRGGKMTRASAASEAFPWQGTPLEKTRQFEPPPRPSPPESVSPADTGPFVRERSDLRAPRNLKL
jgi:hypothetical protein